MVSVYRFARAAGLELDPRVRLACLTDLAPAVAPGPGAASPSAPAG